MDESAAERLRRQIEDAERLRRTVLPSHLLRQMAEVERLRRQMLPSDEVLRQLKQADRWHRQVEELTRSLYGCNIREYLAQHQRQRDAMKSALGLDRFERAVQSLERALQPMHEVAKAIPEALTPTLQAAQRLREQIEQIGLAARLPAELMSQIADQWAWPGEDLLDVIATVRAAEWSQAEGILTELASELPENANPDEAKVVLKRVFEAIRKIWDKQPKLAKIFLIYLLSNVADKVFDSVWDEMPVLVEQLFQGVDADDLDPQLLAAYRAVRIATEVRVLAHDDAEVTETLDTGHLLRVIATENNWIYVSYTRASSGSGRGWVCADHVVPISIAVGSD